MKKQNTQLRLCQSCKLFNELDNANGTGCNEQGIRHKRSDSDSDVTIKSEGWEARYFKGQPTRDLKFQGEESEISEFGYKVRRGNEIFTVVDWENIKKFISHEIAKARSEGEAHKGAAKRQYYLMGYADGKETKTEEIRKKVLEEVLGMIGEYGKLHSHGMRDEHSVVKDLETELRAKLEEIR